MSSLLLGTPGAVPADPPDEGVAAHYGDPLREQRALAAGDAAVDLSHRPVIRIGGVDRLTWLHSLTSQHLEALPPGTARDALILSPNGHVEHALYLVDDGDATWLHVEPGTDDDLLAYLDSMRFWSKVEVERMDSYAIVRQAPLAPVPSDVLVRRTEIASELFLPRDRVSDYVSDRGRAGLWAHEALRIAAGVPRLGFETDHRTIPHELGWLETAVHLQKGCYRGQETVARVHNLGRPPRRLVLLHLDGSDFELPAREATVERDGTRVGFVTSSARHYELGPIALALVKRATPVDAPLLAGGVPAAQQVVVSPEAGGAALAARRAFDA